MIVLDSSRARITLAFLELSIKHDVLNFVTHINIQFVYVQQLYFSAARFIVTSESPTYAQCYTPGKYRFISPPTSVLRPETQ